MFPSNYKSAGSQYNQFLHLLLNNLFSIRVKNVLHFKVAETVGPTVAENLGHRHDVKGGFLVWESGQYVFLCQWFLPSKRSHTSILLLIVWQVVQEILWHCYLVFRWWPIHRSRIIWRESILVILWEIRRRMCNTAGVDDGSEHHD